MFRSYSEPVERARFGWVPATVILAVCLSACSSSGSKGASKPGGGAAGIDAGLVKVKATSVAWVFEAEEQSEPPKTKVLMSKTNETGSTDHTDVGVFVGACKDDTAAITSKEVIIAAICKSPTRGVKLHAVFRKDEIIVLRAFLEEQADELSFDVIKRIKIPIGAVVKAAQQQ